MAQSEKIKDNATYSINKHGHLAVVTCLTEGTTSQNVFLKNGSSEHDDRWTATGFSLTITGIHAVAVEAGYATITIATTAGTVGQVTKSSTSGLMTGATSLSNVAIGADKTLTIFSDVANESYVLITYTV